MSKNTEPFALYEFCSNGVTFAIWAPPVSPLRVKLTHEDSGGRMGYLAPRNRFTWEEIIDAARDWRAGVHVQHAFPFLSRIEREFLISGRVLHVERWNQGRII